MGQLDIFGSETYEYLFVIEPDQNTTQKVIQLRMLVNRFIPLSEELLHSKPHISICFFQASDFSDEYIITRARQILSSIQSFDIQLEGSEQWKNGTLILKVGSDQNTLKLQQQLSIVFKGIVKSLHLTIARNIPDNGMNKLPMEEFQYKTTLKCDSISVLKRKGSSPYHLLEKVLLSN